MSIFTTKNIVNIPNLKTIVRKKSTKVLTELIQNNDSINDKFKNSIKDILKENNIKKFNVELKYNNDTYEYTGNIETKYFTSNELRKNNNILDYYVKVCNNNKK